ncbi:MAG: hypothetical protein IPJ86_04470 [Bacteroidetes bacterium]|nr:hypothetical protein [Bacteroidota bacterium]
MKKFFLVSIILFFSFLGKAQTSIYHPFPDSSANWNFTGDNICWGIFGNSTISYQMTIKFGADTLINSVSYHTLNIPAYIYDAGPNCLNPPPGISVLPGKYCAAIRNDHGAKKVFIIPENDSTEQLLYDFNWQVGDSIKGYLAAMINTNFICDTVISIDSVIVGGSYRKRWYLNSQYNVYLIEGIGSTYGLISPVPAGMVDLDNIVLDCFLQDNIPLYPSGVIGCPVLTQLSEAETLSESLTIVPNPVRDQLRVELPGGYDSKKCTMEWCEISGRCILSTTVYTDAQNCIYWSPKNISEGAYLIRIITDKMIFHSRIYKL